jgi:hypothetical protein
MATMGESSVPTPVSALPVAEFSLPVVEFSCPVAGSVAGEQRPDA